MIMVQPLHFIDTPREKDKERERERERESHPFDTSPSLNGDGRNLKLITIPVTTGDGGGIGRAAVLGSVCYSTPDSVNEAHTNGIGLTDHPRSPRHTVLVPHSDHNSKPITTLREGGPPHRAPYTDYFMR